MRTVRRKNRHIEAEIQKEIVYMLRLNHCKVWRMNVGAMKNPNGRYVFFGEKGFPDLFGCRLSDHQFFGIEVKKPKGYRISPAQMAWHKDAMHYHLIHGIAKSTEDAMKIVKEGLVGYGYPDTEEE